MMTEGQNEQLSNEQARNEFILLTLVRNARVRTFHEPDAHQVIQSLYVYVMTFCQQRTQRAEVKYAINSSR